MMAHKPDLALPGSICFIERFEMERQGLVSMFDRLLREFQRGPRLNYSRHPKLSEADPPQSAFGDVFPGQNRHKIFPRIADRPGCRILKDSGFVPVALRAREDGSLAVERNCIGTRLHVEHHFGIPETGKNEVPVPTDWLTPKACPESFEAFARMPIDSAKAFAARQIDSGTDKFEREGRFPKSFQYS